MDLKKGRIFVWIANEEGRDLEGGKWKNLIDIFIKI